MRRKLNWYKRAKIWGKVRDTFAVSGTITTFGLEAAKVEGTWSYIVAGATLAGTILGIWMSDVNGNGVVDIFEDDQEGTYQITETTKIEVNKTTVE